MELVGACIVQVAVVVVIVISLLRNEKQNDREDEGGR